jgi:hypothetical protein
VSGDVAGDHLADIGSVTGLALAEGSVIASEPEVVAGDGGTEAELWAELWRAIDACVVAESHLRHWLKDDHPPLTAPLAEGVKHYAELSAPFDLWAGCRGIERLRIAADAWRRTTAPAVIIRPDGTREAPRRLL